MPEVRLRLIFTRCHPARATEAQVALTVRTLGGQAPFPQGNRRLFAD